MFVGKMQLLAPSPLSKLFSRRRRCLRHQWKHWRGGRYKITIQAVHSKVKPASRCRQCGRRRWRRQRHVSGTSWNWRRRTPT